MFVTHSGGFVCGANKPAGIAAPSDLVGYAVCGSTEMRLPLLVLHISAGIVGLLSGTAAMIFRKGSRRHAQAGDVFVVAMLTMALCAVWLATLKQQPGNVVGGVFTFYLVATASVLPTGMGSFDALGLRLACPG
jgi:ABC-type transport system involved in cytochrome c biogenesis permease subunit